MGDCVACHTAKHAGAAKFAGGYPLHAGLGTVYSSNITPDRETGIGTWTADQFHRAMNSGIAADGHHLYPAFPYAYFTQLDRADTDAIFAYLKTVKPVHYRPPHNQLIFPANIRAGMIAWNLLFLDQKPFHRDSSKSAEWNRGAELVKGIAHCGGCHTPKNFLFADKSGDTLDGYTADGWFAPNLSGNAPDGLGNWSTGDIVQFLKTGRNSHSWVAGAMRPVIVDSTSRMKDADLHAIAVYLKSLPKRPQQTPDAPDKAQMARGQTIFVNRCAVCHEGDTKDYPSLAKNTLVQSRNPTTVLRIILRGATATGNNGGGYSMPAFPVLSNKDLAAVATYIRNSWGNKAQPVTAQDVKSLRKELKSMQ